MSVLDKIAQVTRERINAEKQVTPLADLQKRVIESGRRPYDFAAVFQTPGYQVIAEVKLASPSKGPIAPDLRPLDVASDYLKHGAAALSVLTEPTFFQGSLDYLADIRKAHPNARLLMKDFVVDPYQLWQGRATGADACLLIVAMLTPEELYDFYAQALELELTPLVEVHTETELKAALKLGAKLIGVNNRDLKTLSTDLETSRKLAELVPDDVTLICESGLSTGQDLQAAQSWGYKGFLIGTHLMATGTPGQALADLLQAAKNV